MKIRGITFSGRYRWVRNIPTTAFNHKAGSGKRQEFRCEKRKNFCRVAARIGTIGVIELCETTSMLRHSYGNWTRIPNREID